MTVGVMGSAGGDIPEEVRRRVYCLGQEVARRGYVLMTGACPGIPHEAVKGAKSAGGFVVGISPALNLREHVEEFQSPTWGYDAIIYTGSGLMGREIENIRSCDVVIFAGGRSGTLGEFAIAYDEGKIIGVLEGTGGITEHLDKIIAFVNKRTSAAVLYEREPALLLDLLEQVYQRQLLPLYESIVAAHDPHGVAEP
ncbi:MAG: LOG family protein [Chloroflexi bacterium]|nr:LOG family protein [Chloroflexota bacterium]